MSGSQSQFEYGFTDEYGRVNEVLKSLTQEQADRYIPQPKGYRVLPYDSEPEDTLWEDANCGDVDATRLLGVIARKESQELRGDFREALPGYTNERFIIPRKRHEPKDMTYEEFEIECLEAEIDLLKIKAAQTRKELSMKPPRKTNSGIDLSVQ